MTDPHHEAMRLRTRIVPFALWGAVLLGLVLRSIVYAANWSLWVDEAAVAVNIFNRSFLGLLRPLDHSQVAPIGFLWMVKACTVVFGGGETALRLFPFLAAAASMPLFAVLARRVLPPWQSVVAVVFFAVSPMAVRYAAELKQYGADAFVTVLMLLMLDHIRLRNWRATAGNVALYALGGLLAVLLSLPSCFVLLAVGCVAMVGAWREGDCRSAAILAAASFVWLAAFALTYHFCYSGVAENAVMQKSWSRGFLDPWPSTREELRANRLIMEQFLKPLAGFGSDTGAWLFGGLMVFGAVRLWQRARFVFFPVAICYVAMFGASFAGQYPVVQRQVLFTLPMVALLVAGMTIPPIHRRHPAILAVLAALAVVLTVSPLRRTFKERLAADGREEIRPLLAAVSDRFEADDVFYIYCAAAWQYSYYRDQHPGLVRFDSPNVYIPQFARGFRRSHNCISDDKARLAETMDQIDDLCKGRSGRIWLILTHPSGIKPRVFFEQFEKYGDLADEIDAPGAWARLYVLKPTGS